VDEDNLAEGTDIDDLVLVGAEDSANPKPEPVGIESWLQWYLSLEDHDFLVEVERNFMKDKFNLIKLREGLFCGSTKMVPMSKSRFSEAIKLILSSKVPSEEDLQN